MASVLKLNETLAGRFPKTLLTLLYTIITMQAQIYWVIILNIVLSYLLNMKNQAQYSANILYILFFYDYLWGVVLLLMPACLPTTEKVLFLNVFL